MHFTHELTQQQQKQQQQQQQQSTLHIHTHKHHQRTHMHIPTPPTHTYTYAHTKHTHTQNTRTHKLGKYVVIRMQRCESINWFGNWVSLAAVRLNKLQTSKEGLLTSCVKRYVYILHGSLLYFLYSLTFLTSTSRYSSLPTGDMYLNSVSWCAKECKMKERGVGLNSV